MLHKTICKKITLHCVVPLILIVARHFHMIWLNVQKNKI